MDLIISFSGRKNGNCDRIAQYIAADEGRIVYFRDLNIHPCSNCNYECFANGCKYREDDIYGLFDNMCCYDRVFLLVPMYCGNPASLYFIFSERCQDYFTHNDNYQEIIMRLYIIGVYGSAKETPDFIPCLEKWFRCSQYSNHVLGLERHLYGQKMNDSVLDIAEIKDQIDRFVGCTDSVNLKSYSE